MKKAILSLTFLTTVLAGMCQKFAYVDSEYILMHMQEYADAQAELNSLSSQWQEQVEQKYESVALLTESFQAEKALLTPDMQKRRESDINSRKKEARDLQKQYFGVDGMLFSKREELMGPVQDMMYEAILEVSSQSGYMVIFDKSNQSNMLYANPKHDVSDKVLKKMGKTPGETVEMPGGEESSGSKGGSGSQNSGKSGAGKGSQSNSKTSSRNQASKSGGGKGK